MKLHFTLLPFILLFFISASFGQEKTCRYDTSHTVRYSPEEILRFQNTPSLRLEAVSDIVPIRIHILTNTAGQHADSSIVMSSLAAANLEFGQFGLQFQPCAKINYIKDDRLYALDSYEEESDMLSNYNDPGTVDIFYVGDINHISACGYATLGWNWDGFIVMLCNNEKVLIHELGHYFNLLHTHDDLYAKELVNGSNCSNAGDQVCDTPADPNSYGLVDWDCKYVGTAVDNNGSPYSPPIDNHMSYSNQTCRVRFTPQQRARMRYYYDQVGKQLFNCTSKPDFAASFVSSSSRMSKLNSNTVSLEIHNNSTNSYTGKLEYTLSLKPLQGNSVVIYTGSIMGTFGRFWSDSVDVLVTVPSQLADGVYELRVDVDPGKIIEEYKEDNNGDVKQVAVYSTEIPLPDLVSFITGNTNHESGTSFRVLATHTNLGNVSAPSSSTGIYLSSDSILEGSDIRVSFYSLPEIKVGESYTYSENVSMPKDLDKVFYVILVADLQSELKEISESNNYYIFPVRNLPNEDNSPRPDLKVTAHKWLNRDTSSLVVLEKPYLQFTIINVGSSTDAPSLTGFYISKDQTLSNDDRFIYSTYSPYAQFTVPLDIQSGQYYLILKADYNDFIYETDELNNTYAIKINITNKATPDIALDHYKLSSYVWEFNKNYTVDIGIKNKGTGTSEAWWYSLHLQKEKYFYADHSFRYLIREYYNSAWRYDVVQPQANFTKYHVMSVSQSEFEEGYYYMAICANNSDFNDWEENNCQVVDKPILFVNKILTGLGEDVENTKQLEIFPNPANEMVTVAANQEFGSIQLFSPTGKEVMQTTSHALDISAFSAGVYVLRVHWLDASTSNKKLVIAGR